MKRGINLFSFYSFLVFLSVSFLGVGFLFSASLTGFQSFDEDNSGNSFDFPVIDSEGVDFSISDFKVFDKLNSLEIVSPFVKGSSILFESSVLTKFRGFVDFEISLRDENGKFVNGFPDVNSSAKFLYDENLVRFTLSKPLSEGKYFFSLKIDPSNMIKEVYEDNNEVDFVFEIKKFDDVKKELVFFKDLFFDENGGEFLLSSVLFNNQNPEDFVDKDGNKLSKIEYSVTSSVFDSKTNSLLAKNVETVFFDKKGEVKMVDLIKDSFRISGFDDNVTIEVIVEGLQSVKQVSAFNVKLRSVLIPKKFQPSKIFFDKILICPGKSAGKYVVVAKLFNKDGAFKYKFSSFVLKQNSNEYFVKQTKTVFLKLKQILLFELIDNAESFEVFDGVDKMSIQIEVRSFDGYFQVFRNMVEIRDKCEI